LVLGRSAAGTHRRRHDAVAEEPGAVAQHDSAPRLRGDRGRRTSGASNDDLQGPPTSSHNGRPCWVLSKTSSGATTTGTMQRGALVISLDFELYWGIRDKGPGADYRYNLLLRHSG